MSNGLLIYLLGLSAGLNLSGAFADLREGNRQGWLWQLAAATVSAIGAGMLSGWL